MKNRKTFMAGFGKGIGVIVATLLSLVVFAYAQNCTLLPTRSPYTTLTDGESRTGYSIPASTYTQTCAQSKGVITCLSGSVANGNIFKYSSCTEQTRNDCTTPTGANHLQYKLLYKAWASNYTQSCQQLSQNLQCLNGVFTWGITPRLYTFATCIDQNRAQCIDTRTNTYRDHGETITAYAASFSYPGMGQSCATLKRTLTCQNGFRAGNGSFQQAWLRTGCVDSWSLIGCVNVRVSPAITAPHGTAITAYSSSISPVGGTCNDILKPLTCINGIRSGNGSSQQAGLFSGCIQAGTAPCPAADVGMGSGSRPHGSFATVFTQPNALAANAETCADFDLVVQCQNGNRVGTWYAPGGTYYNACFNVQSWSCQNPRSTTGYTSPFQSLYIYTATAPTAGFGCDSIKVAALCSTGSQRYISWSIVTNWSTYHPNCWGCITARWLSLNSWDTAIGYSMTGVSYPKSCNQFSTVLTCNGNSLNGNRQNYKYASCADSGWLVTGIDLTIDQSPARTNYLIAQGSSPEINILFYNHGSSWFDLTDVPAGLLTCTRSSGSDININVYSSNVLDTFNVGPGAKVGVNIRIKSIFTQAEGKKTMVCKIQPNSDLWGGTTDRLSNNIRTWTFEVVKADRFDLALSQSIQGINQNLEAAEGAKGTQWLQNFLFNKIMNVLVPLVIIIGILSAILGFYKLMFSSDENATKEGTRYIIFGVIGIILIMSAKFIGQNVFDMLTTNEIVGQSIAEWLYNRIIYPFIKLAIYLVLGAMFVILVWRVITFIFGSDADAQKKAGTLIWRNVISMLVIIGAKQIVEAIYGKQSEVINPNATNLGEIGSGILANKHIPIIYQVMNYALGIASLIILIIIIVQTVKLLMKPDDPAQVKSIKNSLLYMFIGILILGAAYLIVNFAIIQ